MLARRSCTRAVIGPFFAALLWHPPATAQDARRPDVPAAAAAFDNGLADMEAGRYETGCPSLAESFRLDPRPGVLFTEAECEARWGHIATALAHYSDFLQLLARLPADQQSKHADRQKIADEQKVALAARVPRIRLVLPASAPAGTTVSKDGAIVGAALLGVWLPVDPGVHAVSVQAPGSPVCEQRAELAEGDTRELVLEVGSPSPVAAPAPSRSADPDRPPTGTGASRRLAYATGAVAIVGLSVGAVTGALALGDKGTVDDHCSGAACRDRVGLDAAESGQKLALVSTVSFAVGLVAVGATVFLLLSDRKPSAPPLSGTAWADPRRGMRPDLGARW